ncbi:kinase domain protein (macronuclear) [Tetrahymena thermophila SB210]|uniref:Kinase domain protein n=1 Tax=Tetrahymena thermophila (strain SB210) TaxID=312017 RepID=Q22KJ6_TETTS|nr:kinase domain protein [Tetrahymena thermophila SB210]EAR85803.2 kinase domain protein [Tetrahymena thermophila SB210]|eukprot:XP_001033466.2 kinase domain protein [Tetrahymena thermophila SB210]
MKCFENNIVIADDIFLSLENGDIYLYVVEPYKDDTQHQDIVRLVDLLHFCKINRKTKLDIFINLLNCLQFLQDLDVQYIELNPKSIWIQNEQKVYLKPFNIDIEESYHLSAIQQTKAKYTAPEIFFQYNYGKKLINKLYLEAKKADIWSLGCIFCELFITEKPLFESENFNQQAIKYFEILGIPDKSEIIYIEEDIQKAIDQAILTKGELYNISYINTVILNCRTEYEKYVILNTLQFDPQIRTSLKSLLEESQIFHQEVNKFVEDQNGISQKIVQEQEKQDWWQKDIDSDSQFSQHSTYQEILERKKNNMNSFQKFQNEEKNCELSINLLNLIQFDYENLEKYIIKLKKATWFDSLKQQKIQNEQDILHTFQEESNNQLFIQAVFNICYDSSFLSFSTIISPKFSYTKSQIEFDHTVSLKFDSQKLSRAMKINPIHIELYFLFQNSPEDEVNDPKQEIKFQFADCFVDIGLLFYENILNPKQQNKSITKILKAVTNCNDEQNYDDERIKCRLNDQVNFTSINSMHNNYNSQIQQKVIGQIQANIKLSILDNGQQQSYSQRIYPTNENQSQNKSINLSQISQKRMNMNIQNEKQNKIFSTINTQNKTTRNTNNHQSQIQNTTNITDTNKNSINYIRSQILETKNKHQIQKNLSSPIQLLTQGKFYYIQQKSIIIFFQQNNL